MQKLSGTSGHIILYAKGWYTKKNTFSDLKQIVGKFSGIDPGGISHRDVLYWLAKTVSEVYSPEHISSRWWSFVEEQISPIAIESNLHDIEEQLLEELNRRDRSTSRVLAKYNAETFFKFYLSFLQRLDVEDKFDLGEPDKEVLPLAG